MVAFMLIMDLADLESSGTRCNYWGGGNGREIIALHPPVPLYSEWCIWMRGRDGIEPDVLIAMRKIRDHHRLHQQGQILHPRNPQDAVKYSHISYISFRDSDAGGVPRTLTPRFKHWRSPLISKRPYQKGRTQRVFPRFSIRNSSGIIQVCFNFVTT